MMFDEDVAPRPALSRSLSLMSRIWAVESSIRALSRTMERALGISGPLRLVLRVAATHPGIGAGELAELLHLDASTLSGHLQRLEHEGLIQRRTNSADARRVDVYLTPRGKRLDVRTPGTVEAAVESLLGDDAEVVVVEAFLSKLVAALDEQAAKCVAPSPARRRRAR